MARAPPLLSCIAGGLMAVMWDDQAMNWLVILGIAVVVAALAAVTGIKPKGSRPVARSRMMGMARIALVAIVIILLFMAWQARAAI